MSRVMYVGKNSLVLSLISRILSLGYHGLSHLEPIVQGINFVRSLDFDLKSGFKDGFGNPGIRRISQSKRRKTFRQRKKK